MLAKHSLAMLGMYLCISFFSLSRCLLSMNSPRVAPGGERTKFAATLTVKASWYRSVHGTRLAHTKLRGVLFYIDKEHEGRISSGPTGVKTTRPQHANQEHLWSLKSSLDIAAAKCDKNPLRPDGVHG